MSVLYITTLSYLQAKREREEQKEVEEVIKLLMLNVLPEHVADHYLQYGQENTEVGVVMVITSPSVSLLLVVVLV